MLNVKPVPGYRMQAIIRPLTIGDCRSLRAVGAVRTLRALRAARFAMAT